MKIIVLRNTETVLYAAEELKKYAEKIDPSVRTEITDDRDADGIKLGLLSDFGLDEADVNDAMIDDVVDVNIDSLHGYIAGSNERSILFGVYKYFKSAGCRWVRPGIEGEYLPKADLTNRTFTYRKKADFPFRGQAIEGAVSYEHLRDVILWMPKVDMNLFQMEQVVPYNYIGRWYKHLSNTKLPHDDIPYEQYCELCQKIERLVKKIGMQLHALGHGAITEPFGVRYKIGGLDYEVSDETLESFALVKGKRDTIRKYPFGTQLCMSKEWVQDRVINWLADYLKEKPYIDFLHFWLGDGTNNHCECEECVKKTPSDWYVNMLNKLDKKLAEQGSDAKIVFIMYVDTLWPPIVSRLNNPSRFIVVTACGSGKGYSAKRREGGIPPWKRNDFAIEGGLDLALSFIDGWKAVFDGPKFVYEYLFYTRHYSDPGYMAFARMIANNAKQLSVTEFHGIMSDGTQRAFFPTGLPYSVFGEFLFDTSIDTKDYINRYLADSFGEDWEAARDYLEKLSTVFNLDALELKVDITAQDTGTVDKLAKQSGIFGNTYVGDQIATTPAIVDALAPTVEKNLNSPDKCHKESWRILTYHGNYCKGLAKIYFALSRDDTDSAKTAFAELMEYLSEVELEIDRYFDLYLFHQRTNQLINGKYQG